MHWQWHRQSGRGGQERITIVQLIVPKEELPPPDAKPQWHTLLATIAAIDPNQAMYYEANPENNRKACPQVSHALSSHCQPFGIAKILACPESKGGSLQDIEGLVMSMSARCTTQYDICSPCTCQSAYPK